MTPWEIVWKGNLLAIERHKVKGYERAVRPPGVRLILTDAEDHILITEEFRNSLGRKDFRLPGGKVFDDIDSYLAVRGNTAAIEESVLRAGQLEAKEEAGVDRIDNLCIFSHSIAGTTIEWDLYYLSGILRARSEQQLGHGEAEHGITVHFFSRDEVRTMIHDGRIAEDRTQAVLARYLSK